MEMISISEIFVFRMSIDNDLTFLDCIDISSSKNRNIFLKESLKLSERSQLKVSQLRCKFIARLMSIN